ncbi:amidohydrolase family protein [Psychromicrobium lacuslunae]|uniref:Amidohydrolase-related domain-containing protein n=1 Tax=Psychromicrobium lacuslunae TaxID=1618207 RepID=A0A0D4C3K5_9MICC|nr:amidohydrolase family protein [Psychromicrobium lacuslunae]AJT43109.1 hypothetical protein UM93_12425 [Psychromicrobium lacuslunae]
MNEERLDAHLHLWRLAPGAYPWLRPGPLYRDFDAVDARAVLGEAGVNKAILVQADDTTADTDQMLAAAEEVDWIIGVVGWLPLDEPVVAEQQLAQWREHKAFCGVRHLIHDDPRDGFLGLAAVQSSLRLLAQAELSFDLADAWPRHLSAAVELADAIPELTLVLDHLGKPPAAALRESAGSSEEFYQWRREIENFARRPQTFAKLSGLRLAGNEFSVANVRTVWEVALEAFGPQRLMFGGDWPFSTLGNYAQTTEVLAELIAELSVDEQQAIWAGTARRAYRRA